MKKLLLAFALAGGIAAASLAEEYPYMVFRHTDGTQTTVASSGLRLRVENGNLLISNSDALIEPIEYPLASLTSMAFATESSGVADEISESVESVRLYDINGRFIGKFSTPGAAEEAAEPEGVYVVKSEKGSEKIFLKR